MAREDKNFSFIYEQALTVSPSQMEILEESKTESGKLKVTFESRLQEEGVKNNNKRIYDSKACNAIVEALGPKAASRNLLMEVDHPLKQTTLHAAMHVEQFGEFRETLTR